MITTATLPRVAAQPRWLIWGYLLLLTTAELLTSLVQLHLGLLLHILLLVALALHAALGRGAPDRQFALALTLAPLIRMLSLSLPLLRFPQLLWYPLVAAPLLGTTWLIIRQLRYYEFFVIKTD